MHMRSGLFILAVVVGLFGLNIYVSYRGHRADAVGGRRIICDIRWADVLASAHRAAEEGSPLPTWIGEFLVAEQSDNPWDRRNSIFQVSEPPPDVDSMANCVIYLWARGSSIELSQRTGRPDEPEHRTEQVLFGPAEAGDG